MSENRRILYGYTVKSGRTVIEPREAGTIRRIFENYINGASLKDIAEELSANQVPFTIKNCSWDKARVARIIENSKYAGDEDHDPIIEPGIFMLAAECKKSRQKGTYGCSRVIELIGSRVKCAECGHPMLRRTVNNSVIRETWRCQNPECGAEVHISDYDLTEKIRILINRVIQNSNLLLSTDKRIRETAPEVEQLRTRISDELKRPGTSESQILEMIGEIAAAEYRSSCSREAITARLAKQRVDLMTPQGSFNETYFCDIVKTVLLSETDPVRIITKTDAKIGGKE